MLRDLGWWRDTATVFAYGRRGVRMALCRDVRRKSRGLRKVARARMRRQKQAREHAAQAVLFDRLEWQLTELRGHLDRAAHWASRECHPP